MSRAADIKRELDDYFQNTFHVAVSTPDTELWESLIPEFGPSARFGWVSPVPYDDPPFLVPYCPDLIAEQTEMLTDVELNEYLAVIKWDVGGHILHWDDVDDPDARQAIAASELYEEYPGSLAVWNRVQLAVLDKTAH